MGAIDPVSHSVCSRAIIEFDKGIIQVVTVKIYLDMEGREE
jgi:hypothetical protein